MLTQALKWKRHALPLAASRSPAGDCAHLNELVQHRAVALQLQGTALTIQAEGPVSILEMPAGMEQAAICHSCGRDIICPHLVIHLEAVIRSMMVRGLVTC